MSYFRELIDLAREADAHAARYAPDADALWEAIRPASSFDAAQITPAQWLAIIADLKAVAGYSATMPREDAARHVKSVAQGREPTWRQCSGYARDARQPWGGCHLEQVMISPPGYTGAIREGEYGERVIWATIMVVDGALVGVYTDAFGVRQWVPLGT
jgi:hypothetical protein